MKNNKNTKESSQSPKLPKKERLLCLPMYVGILGALACFAVGELKPSWMTQNALDWMMRVSGLLMIIGIPINIYYIFKKRS